MGVTEAIADAQSKFWRLRRSPFLDCLSDTHIKQLGELCEVRVLDRGAVIYDAGDMSDRVFILETGAVKLARTSEDGREVTVGVLGPTEMFGERALSGEEARSDRATALDAAVVCEFEHEPMERFLFEHPELALRVTRLVGERLHRVEDRIQDILFKDVRTRLAHTVARLSRKFGQESPEGITIGIRLTQSDLAQLIGSTRETTSTIFNEFRRKGLLTAEGYYVVVLDYEGLAHY